MRGGEAFHEVLERRLTADEPAPPIAWHSEPVLPFSSSQQYIRFHAFSSAARMRREPAVRQAAPTSAPAVGRRILSTRQQRALEGFLALGVALVSDFTASDLRQAFRTLARRYHPDRHPDRSEHEKARLSRLFAEINEHHDQLMAALVSR